MDGEDFLQGGWAKPKTIMMITAPPLPRPSWRGAHNIWLVVRTFIVS